jgi:hypothetical protein
VRHQKLPKSLIVALAAVAPLIAGCSGNAPDLLSKDAEWFQKPGRLFIRNISIESPPLTPDKPVTAEDLVSADGACPGMAPPSGPADANASTTSPAPTGGTVALGHAECDVVRGIGAPSTVNLSSDAAGRRVAVVTWTTGPRAGIYTFTSGRLSSIEGTPEAPALPKSAKPKPKKKSA